VTFDARQLDFHTPHARRAAAAVVPAVLDLWPAASVVDVGCGDGAWLEAFGAAGVAELLGVDGAAVPPARLLIPPSSFLRASLADPLRLGRRFDLVLSLEVAEHLPASSAAQHVASLTDLAEAVLFSAAIPRQGGIGHRNERWPAYWWRMFNARGYAAVDLLRARFWDDERVAWWYAQNLLFYVRRDALGRSPRLAAAALDTPPAALVHPANYRRAFEVMRLRSRAGRALAVLRGAVRDTGRNAVRRVWRRFR